MCDNVILEPYNKELECRKLIMQSIDNALKRGDEIFERLISKENETSDIAYSKFKESLNKIDHENLKR